MDITLRLGDMSERTATIVLNAIVEYNVRLLRRALEAGRPLPLLYDSGVVYRRETVELWSGYDRTLEAGHEDCDSLAPARAAELIVYGYKALRPEDGGYEAARARRLKSIPAHAWMSTRVPRGGHGQYHCLVGYTVAGCRYGDDPSARLGMYDGLIDKNVLQRWSALGVRPRVPLERA